MNQNESKTNIVAILGFIFSLILGGVGLILSILGLIESKKTNNGKGLSIAGIIISSIRLVIMLIVTILIISVPTTIDTINKAREKTYCQTAYDCVQMKDGTYNCKYKDNEGIENRINCPEGTINNNDSNDKITNFLTDAYISTSGAVGSSDPEGYYFDKNGNFAFYHGGYCIREENQKISYRGTWELENDELILNVTEEEIAIGGTIEEDVVNGKCLTNYKNKINKTDTTINYKILELVEESNNYKYIKLENGDNFYRIGADFQPIKSIANNGYKNENTNCQYKQDYIEKLSLNYFINNDKENTNQSSFASNGEFFDAESAFYNDNTELTVRIKHKQKSNITTDATYIIDCNSLKGTTSLDSDTIDFNNYINDEKYIESYTTNEVGTSSYDYKVNYFKGTKIEYSKEQYLKFKGRINQELFMVSGNIILSNIDTKDIYVIKKIKNVETIGIWKNNGLESDKVSYIILTEDKKLYYINSKINNITNLNEVENLIKSISLNGKIEKVGIATDKADSSTYLAVKTNDNNVTLYKYNKNLEFEKYKEIKNS